MKSRALSVGVVAVSLLLASSAFASEPPPPPGIVYVDDGSSLAGTIVEQIEGDHVSVVVGGSLVVVPWARVVRIERLVEAAPAAPPFVAPVPRARPRYEPSGALSISPISTFFLGAVLEVEGRVSEHTSLYGVGEAYFLWRGLGLQAGVRYFYSGIALDGFFVDFHARVANLYANQIAGGGIELGGEHVLGRSHWSILWSAGADVGSGSWFETGGNVGDTWMLFSDRHAHFTATPKLRFMLGYTF